MIALPTDSWGPEAPLSIPPTTGQKDPRREPPHEPRPAEPVAEGIELPEDRVSLSGQALEAQQHDGTKIDGGTRDDSARGSSPTGRRPSDGSVAEAEVIGGEDGAAEARNVPADGQVLDPEDEEQVRELKQRDAEVKAHEQAHMAAGGGLVQGAASYTYEKGPDGTLYAVGGEVKIDTSPARTPDQTIDKAQQIRRAALAPSQPSSTDRSVATAASQMEAQARSEKIREASEGDEAQQGGPAADAQAGAEAPPAAPENAGEQAPSPFTMPAIQAYQAAASTGPTAQTFKAFA